MVTASGDACAFASDASDFGPQVLAGAGGPTELPGLRFNYALLAKVITCKSKLIEIGSCYGAYCVTNTKDGQPSSFQKQITENSSGAFENERNVKRALAALQRGPIRFQRNNVIACEGDAADYMFLVVGGAVRTCKTFQNGTRSVVAFYLPGDLFGFWSGSECALSVEAAADAMVLFLKRDALFSVASRESAVASFLLDIAAAELRRSQEHALLMSKSAKSRVAAFLGAISKKLGTANINFPMSHQDIADHLGLTIETLSRTITALERSKLVAREFHTLTVRNSLALAGLTE